MKFFEAIEGYTPYSKEAINSMVAGLLRRKSKLDPNAPKGFNMKSDMTAPLTNEEALPMLWKKHI